MLPIGFFVDTIHYPRVHFTIACVMWSGSLVLFGVSTFFREMDLHFWWVAHVSLLLCGIAPAILFVNIMKSLVGEVYKMDLIKGWSEHLTVIIMVCWDISVMPLVYFIATYGNVRILWILIGLVVIMIPFMITYWIGIELPTPPTIGFQIQSQDSDESTPLKPKNSKETETPVTKEETPNILKDPKWWASLLLSYFFVIMIHHNQTWYLSTIYDQALSRSGNPSIAELHTTVFAILIPVLGVISGIFFGHLLGNQLLSLLVLLGLYILSTLVRNLPSMNAQYLQYVCWLGWRINAYSWYTVRIHTIAEQLMKQFPGRNSPQFTILTAGHSMGGLISFLSLFWDYLVKNHLNGSFLYPNIGIDSFTLLSMFLLVGYILRFG